MSQILVRQTKVVTVVHHPRVVVTTTPKVLVARERPVALVKTNPALPPKVLVLAPGPQGLPGPQNLHVHPAPAPVFSMPGLWIETGLGPLGEDMTFWVEDGT